VNRLYFGDNLGWLRNKKEFPDASVDLVYLDPPFNSNADYNVRLSRAITSTASAEVRTGVISNSIKPSQASVHRRNKDSSSVRINW
jgi:16S rRNA G966 N2-methylase RsmD